MALSYFKNLSLMSLLSCLPISAGAGDYCAAIRGNGELMPAHWGALSQVIEQRGLPKMMAGGSSAAISIFLLESVSLNKAADSSLKQALLVKSFQGYLEALSLSQDGKSLMALLGQKKEIEELVQKAVQLEDALKDPDFIVRARKVLNEIEALSFSEDFRNLLNPELVRYVQGTLSLANSRDQIQQKMVRFRSQQISIAIKKFGSFDALNDETLFARPGVLDFKALTNEIGKMGDFYANLSTQANSVSRSKSQFDQFLISCAPSSLGKTWSQLSSEKPLCQKMLVGMVLEHLLQKNYQASRLEEKVGKNISAMISTSVIQGPSVQAFEDYFKAYHANSEETYPGFKVQSTDDLRFGYWGPQNTLSQVQDGLMRDRTFQRDQKSQMFVSLGEATWRTVLALSPAEPGLARVTAISRQQLSAGGWSDLHPVPVLKMAGCDDVIYFTRKGGESAFAQAMYKRLADASEAELDALYGQNNTQSSMLLSQSYASEIKCTNWNSFNVKTQLNALVEEAYLAPLITEKVCQ